MLQVVTLSLADGSTARFTGPVQLGEGARVVAVAVTTLPLPPGCHLEPIPLGAGPTAGGPLTPSTLVAYLWAERKRRGLTRAEGRGVGAMIKMAYCHLPEKYRTNTFTLADIASLTERQAARSKQVGPTLLEQVKRLLAAAGLRFRAEESPPG